MATKKRKSEKATKPDVRPDPVGEHRVHNDPSGDRLESLGVKVIGGVVWDASRPSVAEHSIPHADFFGFVALGVDNEGSAHCSCDEFSAERAIAALCDCFGPDTRGFDGAQCLVPSSIRVLRIGLRIGEPDKPAEAKP